jgi:hypothetical protein
MHFIDLLMFVLLELPEKCHNVGQFMLTCVRRFVDVLKWEVLLIYSIILLLFFIKLECGGG